jgi:AraC-like DNA-binding protein
LPEWCEDPDVFVPLRGVWGFLDEAARREGSLFGWQAGRFAGDRGLNRGLLKRLERAPTLFQALQRFIRLAHSEASHVKIEIRAHGSGIILCTHYPTMKGVPGYSTSQAYQLGVLIDLVRWFAGADWMPEEIGVEHPVVPVGAQELYRDSRVLPRQQVGYITIPGSCLHLAPPPDQPDEEEDSPMPLAAPLDYVDTIRALLKPHLSSGRVSAPLAATLMDTSVRTLERRLSACGTTYRAMVDELRFREARRLLEETSERIIDIAGVVGFDDPAHFTRMFRRVGGLSPREFREACSTDFGAPAKPSAGNGGRSR